jgi:hypothetical protein
MPFAEAAALISQFPSVGAVTRHIVCQMLANPEMEGHWRAIAAACEELLKANYH